MKLVSWSKTLSDTCFEMLLWKAGWDDSSPEPQQLENTQSYDIWSVRSRHRLCVGIYKSISCSHTVHFENVWKERNNVFLRAFFKVLVTGDTVNKIEQSQARFSWNWHSSVRRWNIHSSNKWPGVTDAARKRTKASSAIRSESGWRYFMWESQKSSQKDFSENWDLKNEREVGKWHLGA